MASSLQLFPLSLIFLLTTLLIFSPAYSLKCTSQNFTGNTHYSNCTDLSSLDAYLHWTYDPTNSTLSIAFAAPPAESDGWIAWAINPTATGMAGAQALLAYKASNGSMVVKTYNISSYSSIIESKLSFDVLDKKAEFSKGVIRIFAVLALPESMTTVNHIWQVGPSVKDGVPAKHAFELENLDAKGTLELVKAGEGTGNTTASAPVASGPSSNGTSGGGSAPVASGPSSNGTSGGGQNGKDTAGCRRTWENNSGFLAFYGFLLFAGIIIMGF